MSELLPTVQSERVRRGLRDYLTTTFGLADADARDGLDTFLSDPVDGMFKGPYVRLRLPFRPADKGWRDTLEWYEGFAPYGHQAAAFARLSSWRDGRRRRPLPTLVTTGTGSGKTEAFLYPILDHVLRARRDGVTGTKALILYPMNALANDQALRLARILTGHPELAGVTAAIYTGQRGKKSTMVSADGLITDRSIIREDPPDILLTNYKMLDQLLLRRADQDIWRLSATSLQYLVLDEFHTYDGAQGTDVAMLLRRLGLALKSHWRDDDATLTPDDRARPLGRLTPVATSATLGDKGDPEVMLDFARTVFGEHLGADAVVTESRLSLDEWVGEAPREVTALGLLARDAAALDLVGVSDAVADLGTDPHPDDLALVVLRHLYDDTTTVLETRGADPELQLLAVRAHPVVQRLVALAGDAVATGDLAAAVFGSTASSTGSVPAVEGAIAALVGLLGHVRAHTDRRAVSVETHLWVRELTRVDRAADTTARFRWSDDGPPVAGADLDELRPSFPAVYCRHCGRSGWGVELAPYGQDLAVDDAAIRRNHAARAGRFRALIYAPGEADQHVLRGEPVDGLTWFSVRGRTVLGTAPGDDDPDLAGGWVLPVLSVTGKDPDKAARDDTCPACGQEDGIRFLGSAIATLLSVSLSTLFGSGKVDPREKKALVFTDSVQDAAHRAGFVQARSHVLTLRAVLREAVSAGAVTLDDLVREVLRRAGDDPVARYRLIAPDCADRESFAPFWREPASKVPVTVARRVRRRLAFDVARELGLNSRTGRTLENTGSVAVAVDVNQPSYMATTARAALSGFALNSTFDGGGDPSDADLVRWVRGVVERMRVQGSIDHEWFEKYRDEDGNRWWITGGRKRQDGMPGFPPGLPGPGYPRVGPKLDATRDRGLDAVTPALSWFAIWTSKVLPVSPHDGGVLVKLLLERLAKDGVLSARTSASNAQVYGLPRERVVVVPTTDADLSAGRHLLVCDVCRAPEPGTVETVDQLAGGPCLVARCTGTLARAAVGDSFYRELYASPDMRRVVAREHTSLLPDEVRLAYETGFKSSATDPQAPNVLVATPTLEMGIDIGDLSTVFLASLPRTVASYVQRVGRAGRLTGNALDLAYVTGRGDQLPKLGEPLSVINGDVVPPATYLDAEEILQRQYVAHLIDTMARDASRPAPKKAAGVLGSSEPGTFLGDLIALAEDEAPGHLARFLGAFDGLGKEVVTALTDWATPHQGPGSSGLAQHLHAASGRWQIAVEALQHRLTAIEDAIPDLFARAESPAAVEEDLRAYRSALVSKKLTAGQLSHLRSGFWIAALEEHGVLPNYTLLDDAVTLDVGLSWTDPDSGEFQTEHASFERGSAQAIREFAPGATFYARGWEIAVDAIDLGMDGESIRPWVFCPACGFGVDVAEGGTEKAPAACPRCGSAAIADVGQRLDVVELRHVTAEVRRDEATISDRRDERERAPFQMVTTVDLDPAQVRSRWFVESNGFGCTYARQLAVRWVNLGKPAQGGARTLSGRQVQAGLFRVCEGCGKLDSDSGRNKRHEHRPWCRHRDAVDEHTVSVALTRTLRTQGLLLRLPYRVTVGDAFAIPSLSAAVLLGLREQIGGHPDHLQVEHVIDPTLSDGSDNHDALLVHDIVPGGTGYLAELATPERLHELLVLAFQRVRDCECRTEDRLACHRCLLPFAPPALVPSVSRAAAERHLRTLLDIGVDEDAGEAAWDTTDEPVESDSWTPVERELYQLVVERVTALGAKAEETPGPWGNTLRFTLPGASRRWTLVPQVDMGGCRPDFVLSSNDPNIPRAAIFVDGHQFHATVAHNRMADDAAKRAALRDEGHLVLAITAADLAAARSGAVATPGWFNEKSIATVQTKSPFMAPPAAYESLRRGPVGFLADWVSDPNPVAQRAVARAVAVFLGQASTRRETVPATTSLEAVAAAVLRGEPLPTGEDPSRGVLIRHTGALAVVVAADGDLMRVVAVLDDRTASIDSAHADAWREWLTVSNALALRDWPTTITTITLAAAGAASEIGPDSPLGTTAAVAAPWQGAYETAAEGAERAFVVALAERDVAVPAVGYETPDDGIPIDLSWPDQRVAVALASMPQEDRVDLEAAGWRVVPPDLDLVVAALDGGRPDTAQPEVVG